MKVDTDPRLPALGSPDHANSTYQRQYALLRQHAQAINAATTAAANAQAGVDGLGTRMDGFGIGHAIALDSNVDLNTITAPGFYCQVTNAGAASGANYPVPLAGSLVVLETNTNGGEGLIHIYTTYDNTGQYRRTFYTNWSPWVLIGDSNNQSQRKRRFTQNGTFVVPTLVSTVYVSGCAGGGGGGGGSGYFTNNTYAFPGGGGGAGQFVIQQPVTVNPGDSINVTVGAGGAGGASGAADSSYGENGSSGGASMFGSFIQLSPGGGGYAFDGSTVGYGGSGYPGGNDATTKVDTSIVTSAFRVTSGSGASTPFGTGGPSSAIQNSSNPFKTNGHAYGYGAGGGGAPGKFNSGGPALYSGGNGAPGIIIVEW